MTRTPLRLFVLAAVAAVALPAAAAEPCRPADPTASVLAPAPPPCAPAPAAKAKPAGDLTRTTLPDGRTRYGFGDTTVVVGGNVQVDVVGSGVR